MMYDYANPTGDVARPGDFRDPIAHALELQRRRKQQQMQQQATPPTPFAPPVPQSPVRQMQQLSRPAQPAPMIGTPQPRPQEANPYGFQSGYNSVVQPREDTSKDRGWKDLYDRFTGGLGPQGSDWT